MTRSTDPSFPSDHTTAAFAIAVAVALRFRRLGWVALAFAAALADLAAGIRDAVLGAGRRALRPG